jgi:hypothetical protein
MEHTLSYKLAVTDSKNVYLSETILKLPKGIDFSKAQDLVVHINENILTVTLITNEDSVAVNKPLP